MNRIVDPGTLEYFAAVGACGLDILLEDLFQPFLVIFDNLYAKAGRPNDLIVYKILDPRAIEIMQMEDGLHYSIGLAYSQRNGVTDIYSPTLLQQVLPDSWVIKMPPPDSPDAWYTWGVIRCDD
jgi:hypothetical protein